MANGTGWHLTDWNLLNTIKRLCYIEFCDFIVTKYLGTEMILEVILVLQRGNLML